MIKCVIWVRFPGSPHCVEQFLLYCFSASVELVVGEDLDADARQRFWREHQHAAIYGDPQLKGHLLWWLLHQAPEHFDHAQAAFDRSGPRIIDAITGNPKYIGGHRANRAQCDRALSKGGQYARDVVHEDLTRPDHQHTAGFKAATVGVEQVRRAVQCDYRFPSAGSTSDHREALVRRSDRLILLSLNGGDDVPHRVVTSPRKCCQQRALSDDHQLVVGALSVEEIVFNPDHPSAPAVQNPTADHLHRVTWGGSVERFGGRCPPVDDKGLVVGVAYTDPTDIAHFAVSPVQPAEDQSFLLGI